MIDHHLLILKRVFSSHKLEDNQPSTGARYLANRAHEEVSIEILAPPARSLCEFSALAEGFLVGVVVAEDYSRWSIFLVRLEV